MRVAPRNVDGPRHRSLGPEKHAFTANSVYPRPHPRVRAVLQRSRLRETNRVAAGLREFANVQRVRAAEARPVDDADVEGASRGFQARGDESLRGQWGEDVPETGGVLRRRGGGEAGLPAAAGQQGAKVVADERFGRVSGGSGEGGEGGREWGLMLLEVCVMMWCCC